MYKCVRFQACKCIHELVRVQIALKFVICVCVCKCVDVRHVQGEALGQESERVHAIETAAVAMSQALERAREEVQLRTDKVGVCIRACIYTCIYVNTCGHASSRFEESAEWCE